MAEFIGTTEIVKESIGSTIIYEKVILPADAPSNLAVTAFDETSISIDWDAPTLDNAVDYYEVFLDDVFYENTTDDTLGWDITGLSFSKGHTIKIRAVDVLGGIFSFSNVIFKSTTLLFDGIAGGIFGHFPRKLSALYAGNCYQIRNTSGGTLKNVGFLRNKVNADVISTFLGSGSGTLHTFYDQISGRDFIQANPSSQPKIYNTGTPVTSGGLQSMSFLGFNGNMDTDARVSIMDKNCTVFLVLESQGTSSAEGVFEELSSTNNRITILSDTRAAPKRHTNYAPTGSANYIDLTTTQAQNTKRCLCLRKTGTLIEGFLNGVKINETTSALTFSGNTMLSIGRQLAGTLYFHGKTIGTVGFGRSLTGAEITKATTVLMN